MAAPTLQKKFRIELEFSTSITEVNEENLPPNIPTQALPYLKQLQAALWGDEQALLRLIQARLVGKLQDYSDNLAGQESLTDLRRLDAALAAEESGEFDSAALDFNQLTRPIRVSSVDTCLTSSALFEEQLGPEGTPSWQPVWEDLRPQSPLGQWINTTPNNEQFLRSTPQQVAGHHFLLRFLDRRLDTVHAVASCSCGLSFDGIGAEEGQAFQAAWESYRQHLEAFRLGSSPANATAITRLGN